MRTRLPAVLALLTLASGPAGCVLKRTPEARFFALRAVAEAPAQPEAAAARPPRAPTGRDLGRPG